MTTPPKKTRVKQPRQRLAISLPPHHEWFAQTAKPSLTLEYLLDQLVGCRYSDDSVETERILQDNLATCAKIEAQMLELKKEEKRRMKIKVRSEMLSQLRKHIQVDDKDKTTNTEDEK